ncbi:MAG TPA: hypothetical protein VJ507_02475 [Candidatus Bathyarchaeia archaeon]|nr:hypothetical protein [Candidatus Bathyarchaeia archaeon]
MPYVDPVKYDYQLLPAFCLLAASLVPKAYSIAKSVPPQPSGGSLFSP